MDFVFQAGVAHQPPPAYQQLKRGRPRDTHKFNPSLAPKLPSIGNIDVLLQVFTHPSIRRTHASKSLDRMDVDEPEYADNERLSFLGKYALDALVTGVLFQRRPMLRAHEMIAKKTEILSDESFDDWVTHYDLLRKLRCDPMKRSELTLPEETRAIFYAYVGGVYADSGSRAVQDWLSSLLGQYLEGGGEPQDAEPMFVNEKSPPPVRTQTPPPMKKVKAEPIPSPPPMSSPAPPPPPQVPPPTPPSHTAIFFGTQPTPTPPTVMRQAPISPPPPQMGMHRPNPLAPAQPTLPFLPLFNQTAAQRRVQVEYNAQFAGPSHAGTWVVRCIVNGIPKGEGKGNSKQTAKEEAARQAFYAMGWT